MNANIGTQPTGSNNDNSTINNITTSTASSLTLDNLEAMMVLRQPPQYGSFQPATMGYGQFTLYEKMAQPVAKDTSGMYEHHSNLYGVMAPDHSLSPPPPPRVYKPCVVCSDKSSGYHYGVSSCEGCKGFFRRSVQKNMLYVCHKEKNCIINKITRNRCQFCRLQKCIVMGMSKEAVRNDRNKKRKQKPESTSSLSEDLTEYDEILLQEIHEALQETISNTADCVSDSRTAVAIMDTTATSTTEFGEDNSNVDSASASAWVKISELPTANIALIVNFAKKVRGFSSLTILDQVILLKAAFLEIMILRISLQYDVSTEGLKFSNGLCVSQEQLQNEYFGTVTSSIISFGASLKQMNCDKTEFALLCSVCLISGDRSGLVDTDKIEDIQEILLGALKNYIRSRRPDRKQMFPKILMTLTDLRSITARCEKLMPLHALDCIQDLLMPSLSPTQASVSHNRMTPQLSILRQSILQQSMPQLSMPRQSMPQQSMPRLSLLQQSILQKSVNQQSMSRLSMPHLSMPQQSMPRLSMPHQSMPQQSMPQHQQSMPQQSMPQHQQSMPQQSMPQRSMSQQSLPQQSMPQQSMPQQSMSQQSMHQQSMPQHQQSMPQQSMPQQSMSQQSMSQQSMPQQSMPQQSMPQQSMSQQSMPQQSMPQQSMHQQSMPQQSMPQQSMHQQSMPQQSMPQQSMHQQSMPQQSMPQLSMPNGRRSETLTSASLKHYQATMSCGSSLKSSPSSTISNPFTIYSNGNGVTNGNISSTSNTLLIGTQPVTDERNYITGMLGPDLEAVVPCDFTTDSQSQGSDVNDIMSLNSLSAYSNGQISKQNSNLLNLWENKQQQVLSGASKNSMPASETLEVIVKSTNQSFTDLMGTICSFNRSPNSEAHSNGPLSSPSFLTGVNSSQYPSPSPDLNDGYGTGMMYPTSQAVSDGMGLAYMPPVSMSVSSSFTPEQLLYAVHSSNNPLTQAGLMSQASQEFLQGLSSSLQSLPSSSTSIVPNFLSVSLTDRTNPEMLSGVQQSSEDCSLDRISEDLLPNYALISNMHSQMKDNDSTSAPVWVSETREGNLMARSRMMSLSHGSSHDIGGTAVSSARSLVDSTTDNVINITVSSSKQDNGVDAEARSSSSISISQLIGGAMKIEPDDWTHYSDH